MTTSEQRALHLVQEYKRLTHAIRALTPLIGSHLEQCNGLDGFRKETVHHEGMDAGDVLGWIEPYDEPSERALKDQRTHLDEWFQGEISAQWAASAEECAHCFAAYQIVQKRLLMRRQLGGVKGAMTKFGGKQ